MKRSLAARGLTETCALIDRWLADPWRAERTPDLHKINPNAVTAVVGPSRGRILQPDGGSWRTREVPAEDEDPAQIKEAVNAGSMPGALANATRRTE